MHDFVLETDPDTTADISGNVLLTGSIQVDESLADAVLIFQNLTHRGPIVGNDGMGMAVLRVINIRVDAALKDLVVAGRLCGRKLRHFVKLYVQKGGNVAKIKDASVAKLNRLLSQLCVGQHLARHNVPDLPESLPVSKGWKCLRRILGGKLAEG